eukprot:CAMPEP_0196573156 /NCGR_PEP_ID=MMETSP1081-20130531/3093_1 /TAXON_ID=36882 /ORGANISM="Pyramimonas amylifera, Strain CCMP720" /LENGTH=429 /DNA_ID=CAMNT_0041890773 /DNA_START=113 /DNA_END=1402 /DNA_ORIENTATION=-
MMPVSRLAPSGSVASVKARNAQPKTCLSSKVGVKAALKLGKVQQRAVVSQAAKTVKMTATGVDWAAEAAALDNASPLEIMDHALRSFPGEIGIAFSGAEDVALIHYAHMTGRPFRVFSLDTGRLNSETYYLFDAVEKRYGIRIEYTFPDQQEVMELVREKGLFSFYEDGHQECCRARKVRPLRRQLSTLDAWITGQRKDQSPGTRTEVPVVQVDPAFEGKSGGTGSLIKYNPLSNIIGTDVWAFLRAFDVPTNDLHQQGYVSIGCEPCTRAVLPGQQEREGRWWWEEAADKECGLHKGNIEGKEGGADAGPEEVTDLYTAPAIGKADIEALLTGARAQDTMVVVYAPWCQFCQGFEEQFNSLVAEGGPVKMVKFQGDGDMKEFCQTKLGLQSFPAIYMFPKHTGMVIPYPTDRRDSEFLKAFVRATATY